MILRFPATGTEIECEEVPDGWAEGYEKNAFVAVRTYDVPWDRRIDFIRHVIGWPRVLTSALGRKYVSRVPPMVLPEWTVIDRVQKGIMFAQAVTVSGQGRTHVFEVFGRELYRQQDFPTNDPQAQITLSGRGGLIRPGGDYNWRQGKLVPDRVLSQRVGGPYSGDGLLKVSANDVDRMCGRYDVARIQVRFEGLPYPVRRDDELRTYDQGDPDATPPTLPDPTAVQEWNLERYVLKQMQPNTRFLTLPRGAYLWVSDQVKLDNSNGIVEAAVSITYTWFQVPFLPAAVYTHIGKVNRSRDTRVTRSPSEGTNPQNPVPGGIGKDSYQYADPIRLDFDKYDAETLFLNGAMIVPYRLPTGQRVYDVQYLVKQLDGGDPDDPRGHNFFVRYKDAEDGQGSVVRRELATSDGRYGPTPNGKNRRVFEHADFRDLFSANGEAAEP